MRRKRTANKGSKREVPCDPLKECFSMESSQLRSHITDRKRLGLHLCRHGGGYYMHLIFALCADILLRELARVTRGDELVCAFADDTAAVDICDTWACTVLRPRFPKNVRSQAQGRFNIT